MTRALSCLIPLASLLLASGALAQGVDTASTPHDGSRTQGTPWLPSAQLLPSMVWEASLGYEHDGSVVRAGQATGQVRGSALTAQRRWIADRDLGFVSLSLGLADRLELGAELPVLLGQSSSDVTGSTTPLADSAGLGDLHLGARLSMLGTQQPEQRGLFWTVGGGLSAPSGTPAAAFGEESARFDAATTVTYLGDGPWTATGHLGYQSGKALEVADQLFGNRLVAGASFAWRFLDFQASAQAISRVNTGSAAGSAAPDRASLELLAGLRYLNERFFVDLGAGGAPIDDGLTPRWRALLALGVRGGGVEKAQAAPDPDGDGLDVGADGCPSQAEDLDGYEDRDGCPDWDNDGDRIADARDGCPNAAEDMDSVADDDGCPETDADNDGLLDERDGCTASAEDYDGFEDGDGCPEPGTAPRGEARPGAFEQIVFFESGSTELDKVALATVRSVAQAMLSRPGNVVIYGHADDRGSEELNAQLSLARAESVKAVLVQAGIAPERLQTRGVGQKEPLARQEGFGRALNRRVTFGE